MMPELNYELESQKTHVDIGVVLYWCSDKEEFFVATLELFGNGYDIAVYDNNEHQYTRQSIVKNTSCELLEYTDDEKVIARVNDEILVLKEQQFELIRHHYDMLDIAQDDEWDSDGNDHYFTEDDEAYYIYEALLEEPQNIKVRVKLINVLFDEIRYLERSKTYGDLLKYMSLMEESLLYLISLKS